MNNLFKIFIGSFFIIISTFSYAASQQPFSKVRLFTGEIISVYYGKFPIVATMLENDSDEAIKFIATYFVPEAVSIFIPAKRHYD